MGDTDLRQILRQYVFGKIRLALIQIAGHQLHRQEAAPFQIEQQRQQPIAVLAAGKAYQPALLAVQHAEIFKRLPHIAQQSLAQLVEGNRTRSIVEQGMRTAIFFGRAVICPDLVRPCLIYKVIDLGENVHHQLAPARLPFLMQAMPPSAGNIKPRIPTSRFWSPAIPAPVTRAPNCRPC